MKGLILAAGKGTRLRPLTSTRSKPMLPLAGQPLIVYSIQKLLLAGIEEIGIVVGDNEQELRDGLHHVPAKLTFIRQSEPLGLAHAVQSAANYIGKSEFVMLLSDNLFSEPLSFGMVEWDAQRAACAEMSAMIQLIEVADPRAFGVALVDDAGWVQDLQEKPTYPASNLAVTGVYFFTPRIFEMISRIAPSARGELEITDAMTELIVAGQRVYGRRQSGFWYDTGTIADLIGVLPAVMDEFGLFQAKGDYFSTILAGPVGIARDAIVENCRIIGPVLIGSGCQVRNTELGAYVCIGEGCVVEDCSLSNCQLYPGTPLVGVNDSDVIYDGKLRVDYSTQQ